LIAKYQPDILWFDTPHKLPLSENIRILQSIRAADSRVLVNGRLARNPELNFGDYINTADRPAEFYPVNGDWEAIPTTNESYGYHKFDSSHKSPAHFIRLLASAASRGGNLLMNVGPKGDGSLDRRDTMILSEIGKWMSRYGESIYGTSATPLAPQSWGTSTLKKDRLYLHVFDWPANGRLVVGGLKTGVSRAWIVGTKHVLPFRRINELDVVIDVPAARPDPANTVIALELEGPLATDPARLLSGTAKHRLLAFDAVLKGDGFRFGDGKTLKYFVESWTSKDQSLSWAVRLTTPATFNLILKYLPEFGGGGSVRVLVNGTPVLEPASITANGTEIMDKNMGTLSLPAGDHTLSLVPIDINGVALMKVLEVNLNPHAR
ncbi:MAG TPA: alpha-L-fucosidase, partial [Chryseosolibacter sp.]|nr:alpha-L-fucosidase [Chryseosolibacter sp.]